MPATRDLTGEAAIYRGDDYSHEVTFVDENGDAFSVVGWTFTAQYREYADAPDAIDFDIDAAQAISGVVIVTMGKADTGLLERDGVWDLQVDDGTTTTTWMAGTVEVVRDVTREASP